MAGGFPAAKARILEQLNEPAASYSDLSPKGTVDAEIRTLIDQINEVDDLVTTSSCAGRISVYLEGTKSVTGARAAEQSDQAHDPGRPEPSRKGGGAWLFVSHEPVKVPTDRAPGHFLNLFALEEQEKALTTSLRSHRLIHLKFEPMILHILTASVSAAQRVLSAASASGFRESGAMSLQSSPVVAVRCMGLALDSVIGYVDKDGVNRSLVDNEYLRSLVDLVEERFSQNSERIERFRRAILRPARAGLMNQSWESKEVRSARMKEEGLRIQAEAPKQSTTRGAESTDMDLSVVDWQA